MCLRKIIQRAGEMCPSARWVQKLSIIWAGTMLLGALLLLERSVPLTLDTYLYRRLALALMDSAAATLFVGVIGAVIIEELRGKP